MSSPPHHHPLKGDEEVAHWCILNSKEGFFYGFLKKGTHHLYFMAGAVVTAAAGTLSAKAPSSGTATAHLRSYIQVERGDLIHTFIQNQRRKDDFGTHMKYSQTHLRRQIRVQLENGTFKCWKKKVKSSNSIHTHTNRNMHKSSVCLTALSVFQAALPQRFPFGIRQPTVLVKSHQANAITFFITSSLIVV